MAKKKYQGLASVYAKKVETALTNAFTEDGELCLETLKEQQPEFMADLAKYVEISNNANTVEQRIDKTSLEIEHRLVGSLNKDGKIDMPKLHQNDQELFIVLDQFAMSKTWRDDPKVSARDVAKLLEARSGTTKLGEALENLGSKVKC